VGWRRGTQKGGKLSFTPSFLFPVAPPLLLHIFSLLIYNFTVPTRTTTRITLELCALNAEFQHFVLDLVKLHYYADSAGRGDKG